VIAVIIAKGHASCHHNQDVCLEPDRKLFSVDEFIESANPRCKTSPMLPKITTDSGDQFRMDDAIDRGFRARPLWMLVLLFVAVAQGIMALDSFGGWDALGDDRPILSGRHPLHLYHGILGAETFQQRYATTCYDPYFQAGYPKTPVFDGGCRLAELALVIAGTDHAAAVYKCGLFGVLVVIPIGFAVAGRGAGMPAMGCCIAAALGALITWTPAVQSLVHAGSADLILAGLSAIIFTGWLSRYHWDAGPLAWLVLASTAIIGWYAHPMVWLGLLPSVLVYYVALAPRHGLAWHLGLFGITMAGIVPNLWWLWDYFRFWWLRQPSVDELASLPTWSAIVLDFSDHLDLLGPAPFGWPLAIAGLASVLILAGMGRRSATGLYLLNGLLALLVARLGQVWPPFMNGGTERAAPMAMALAIIPVAMLFTAWAERAVIGRPLFAGILAAPILFAAIPNLRPVSNLTVHRLPMGFNEDQAALIRGLESKTTPAARILIEDIPPGSRADWNWTALLPRQIERSFLGGLDPDARFEHAYCGLLGGGLNGRVLVRWSDDELAEFATRYNVGWVVCRHTDTLARWLALPGSRVVGEFHDGGPIHLVQLARPHSFILAGQAKWEHADRRKIVLSDLVPIDAPNPDGGPIPVRVVVLSLHYQAGLKVSPNIVSVERVPNADDPIPLVRLRMPSPLSRVVLSWENR
jgi:hypothetical protein